MTDEYLQIIEVDDRNLLEMGITVGRKIKILAKNQIGMLVLVDKKTVALDFETAKKIKFKTNGIKKEKEIVKMYSVNTRSL